MNLELDGSLGDGFKPTQWARCVTEGWALANLYCVACTSPSLTQHNANFAVEDFHCTSCRRRIQLKAKNGAIPGTVRNSAYSKKEAAIKANRAPDYCFLGYDREALVVNDLLWVPGHFMTLSVIEKCKPLKAEARRAGWVGSNILLNRIPDHGKIPLVADGKVCDPVDVRRQFQETAFLTRLPADLRGWISDVWACVDSLGVRDGETFGTADLYPFESRLANLHPANHNIEAKIRQKLQVLVANGRLERVQRGIYRRV